MTCTMYICIIKKYKIYLYNKKYIMYLPGRYAYIYIYIYIYHTYTYILHIFYTYIPSVYTYIQCIIL